MIIQKCVYVYVFFCLVFFAIEDQLTASWRSIEVKLTLPAVNETHAGIGFWKASTENESVIQSFGIWLVYLMQ